MTHIRGSARLYYFHPFFFSECDQSGVEPTYVSAQSRDAVRPLGHVCIWRKYYLPVCAFRKHSQCLIIDIQNRPFQYIFRLYEQYRLRSAVYDIVCHTMSIGFATSSSCRCTKGFRNQTCPKCRIPLPFLSFHVRICRSLWAARFVNKIHQIEVNVPRLLRALSQPPVKIQMTRVRTCDTYEIQTQLLCIGRLTSDADFGLFMLLRQSLLKI